MHVVAEWSPPHCSTSECSVLGQVTFCDWEMCSVDENAGAGGMLGPHELHSDVSSFPFPVLVVIEELTILLHENGHDFNATY